ncbi:hypothetical protein D0Z06_11060 [Geodermatophilus marinus]|nr:hypothetical protein D0Z06_11060 [Geodermatophilus sp. LHW52908]
MHAPGSDQPSPRTPAPPRPPLRAVGEPAAAPGAGPPCTCGHARTAHEHYRRGSDCALCTCERYRRDRRRFPRRG